MSLRLRQFTAAFNDALNVRRLEVAAQLCEGVSTEQYVRDVAMLQGMEEARAIAKQIYDKLAGDDVEEYTRRNK